MVEITFIQLSYGISRAKVPGGWLVKTTERLRAGETATTDAIGCGLAFVPDPEHNWI